MSDFVPHPAQAPGLPAGQRGLRGTKSRDKRGPRCLLGAHSLCPTHAHMQTTRTPHRHTHVYPRLNTCTEGRVDIYTEGERRNPGPRRGPRLSACSAQPSALYLAPMPLPEKQLPLSLPPAPDSPRARVCQAPSRPALPLPPR